jgi:small subunit ribosomal protein S6
MFYRGRLINSQAESKDWHQPDVDAPPALAANRQADQKHTQRKEGFVNRDYELGVIFNPEVGEEETRALLDRVDQIVTTHGGQIVKVNQWGRRRLAYPIERHRDGLYVFIDMILTPETVSELERTLKVSEVVLRYMTRKRDAKAVQREREEREARAAAAEAHTAPAAEQPATEAIAETPEVSQLSPEEIESIPPAIEPAEETVEI